MNRHQPYPPCRPQAAQTPAESACIYPRRYARYAEMFTSDTRRCPCGDADGPMRPAPFRHTPSRPWPRQATSVWRNLDQYPRFAGTYTFSAKEKDMETGYSYFGARCYSSDLSVWLSVDPMAGKYPSLSPYTYCANNPVRLVDLNGMFDDEAKAIKIRNRAVRKYGEDRVSDVYNNWSKPYIANTAFLLF